MDRMGAGSMDFESSDAQQQRDAALDALWVEYRAACPAPDAGASFMPNLWHRIEARRTDPILALRRFAKVCFMTTVALVLIFAISSARLQYEPPASANYVDALDAEHAADYVEVADVR
jgi:hypothetical protein